MEIIIDECIAGSTISCLIEAGFKVIKVEEILSSGVDDENIFEFAKSKDLPIFTHDRGFGVLFHFSKGDAPTIIILQVLSPHPEATNKLLKKSLLEIDLALPKYKGKLIIISRNDIRIRSI
jgi:predicted nuclease of predicted toxin-antitoxin system